MSRLLLSLLFFVPALPASAGTLSETWFSHDVSYAVAEGSFLIRPGEAIAAETSGSVTLERLDLGPLPDHVNVSAVHREPDGSVLFAVDTATHLSGTSVAARPNDVVHRINGAYDVVFFGRFTPGVNLRGAAIDAITRDAQGRLALSFDISASLGGGQVMHRAGLYAVDGDTGFFDPVPVFDPVAAGMPAGVNLEAAHFVTDEAVQFPLLLSFDRALWTGVSGNVQVRNHQVTAATPNSLDGLAFLPGLTLQNPGDLLWGNAIRLNALWFGVEEIPPVEDAIFSDRFEQP